MMDWATSISLVLSNRSASAPAASAKKRSGRVDDATIKPTQVFDPVSSSINHEPATDWMKVPRADRTDAIHIVRKETIERGATAELISFRVGNAYTTPAE